MNRRLAIDGVGAKHGGAARIVAGVVAAALEREDLDVTLFASTARLRSFPIPAHPRLTVLDMPQAESQSGRLLWLTGGLPRAVRRAGATAQLALGNGGWPAPGVRSAVLLQQSLPFSNEALRACGLATRVRMAVVRRMMHSSAQRCDVTLVQTSVMKQWVQADLDLPPESVKVVQQPATILEAPTPEHPALAPLRDTPPDRRLLHVGSDAPYKNLDFVSAALPSLRRELPGARLFLTCPPDHPLCRREGVTGLGHLTGGALAGAYALSSLLVMPSLVETVGLPLLEAMSAGLPVVVADRPYAREICADAAAYFDPHDAASLIGAVVGAARPDARLRMQSRGTAMLSGRRAGYGAFVSAALGE